MNSPVLRWVTVSFHWYTVSIVWPVSSATPANSASYTQPDGK